MAHFFSFWFQSSRTLLRRFHGFGSGRGSELFRSFASRQGKPGASIPDAKRGSDGSILLGWGAGGEIRAYVYGLQLFLVYFCELSLKFDPLGPIALRDEL